ncbi:MAG: penicillin acylase family protein, partial [Planctomycetota bacterium]
MAQPLSVAARLGRGLEPLVGAAARVVSRWALLPRRGTLRLEGLGAQVRLLQDAHGVLHIRAASDADAFLAQGFCHAVDRFFQMDMLRRVLRGRLAETVGERRLGARSFPPFGEQSTTLDADRLMRAFDLVGAARRYLAVTGGEDRRLLDAYVRGVNAALVLLRRHRPLEHRLLRLPLLPWNALDSVLVAKGMALGLSFKWRTAPVLAAIAGRLGERPRLLDALLPRAPEPAEAAVARVVTRGIEEALAFLPTTTAAQGSNAFVVGRGLSASGAPLLASD